MLKYFTTITIRINNTLGNSQSKHFFPFSLFSYQCGIGIIISFLDCSSFTEQFISLFSCLFRNIDYIFIILCTILYYHWMTLLKSIPFFIANYFTLLLLRIGPSCAFCDVYSHSINY